MTENLNTEFYRFKLLLEGIECSFMSASVSFSRSGASCSISVPASGILSKIWRSTLVHLMYKDSKDDEYKILFYGFVNGVSFSKGSKSTNMSLSCVAFTHHMNFMYRYFMKNVDMFMASGKQTRFFMSGVSGSVDYIRNENVNNSSEIDKYRGLSYIVDNIKDTATGILDKMANMSPFARIMKDDYKLGKLIHSIKDDYVLKVFSKDAIDNLMKGSSGSSMVTFNQMMINLTSKIYYSTLNMPPTMINGEVKTLAYMPSSSMLPAPMCNVIFPNMAQQINISRSMDREPTRHVMVSSEFSSLVDASNSMYDYFTYAAIAPGELVNYTGNQYLHSQMTPEEYIKGMVPSRGSSDITSKLMGMSKDVNVDSGATQTGSSIMTMCQMSEYQLEEKKLLACGGSCSGMPFNPNLVAGATCAIIDDGIIARGSIESVSHSISKYHYSTSIVLSRCHMTTTEDMSNMDPSEVMNYIDWNKQMYGPEFKNIMADKGDYESGFPAFVNASFTPAGGDYGYHNLIGSKSSVTAVDMYVNRPMIDSIRYLHEDYVNWDKNGNSYPFVKNSTYRSIAKSGEFFDFFGVDLADNKTGSYFNESRRSVILKHNLEVGNE